MANIEILTELPDGIGPDRFYRALCDFGRYPEFAGTVLSVTCAAGARPAEALSTWRVRFREGILQWSEVDRFSERDRTISFELVDGDLESFSGRWSVVAAPGRPGAVLFQAAFDLGIPSLAHILDPLAIESLSDNVRRIVDGLSGKLAGRAAPRAASPIGVAAC